MQRVRWGIMGTARIGTEKVIPAMQSCRYGEVTAIASRNLAIAEAVAKRLGIPRSFGSYEELLADAEIDAVYIPLPNNLHAEWTIKAMEAGKHVLCEKPIALTSAEARLILREQGRFPGLKVMEAFMYRHHPQWHLARSIIRDGGIGDLRTIHSFFSYFNADPGNIRNIREAGGGGLMDIGCYSISLSRYLFNQEPLRAVGLADRDPVFTTDRLFCGLMEFPSGTSSFTCSTQLQPFQRVVIAGSEGVIEIEKPFNPPPDQASQLKLLKKDRMESISVPPCNQYAEQGDAFSRAILDNTAPPFSLQDAAANMRWIEILMESADVQRWLTDGTRLRSEK
jgi:predicted dehydrogenase